MNKLHHIFLSAILFSFFLGAAVPSIAQNGDNPFELPNRSLQTPVAPTAPVQIPEEPTDNPFDINNNNSAPTEIEIPTNTPTPPPEQIVNPIDLPSTTIPSVSEEDNPFEINRISIDNKPEQEASPSPVLQPQKIKSLTNNRNFLSAVSLFLLLFLAILITLYNSVIGQIYRAFLNDNILKLKHREQGNFLHSSLFLLYLSFFFNAGFFCYLLAKEFGWEGVNNWQFLGYCILGIAGVFLIKHLILSILSRVFPIQKELRQYNFTIVVFNIILGIILLPFNLLIAFGPENTPKVLIYSFLAITALIYGFRIIRSLLIGSRYISLHKFHFFMYLCTVEIAPTLVLVKLLLLIQG